MIFTSVAFMYEIAQLQDVDQSPALVRSVWIPPRKKLASILPYYIPVSKISFGLDLAISFLTCYFP